VIVREEAASDLFVAAPKLLEHSQRIDSGQGHNQKKTTEPNHEGDTRAAKKSPL
jgi:hypothetical protein